MVSQKRNYSLTSKPIYTDKLMRGVIKLSSLAIILLGVSLWSEQVKAVEDCSSTYNPPRTVEERRSAGWFDGRVGRISVANNTADPAVITLYHPDSAGSIFKYWVLLPGETYFLGNDNYGSDWGIQSGEGPICLIGKVSRWNNNIFEITPNGIKGRMMELNLGPVHNENGAEIERQGNNWIAQGNRYRGLVLLQKAADVYSEQNRSGDHQRVTQRIRQLRGW